MDKSIVIFKCLDFGLLLAPQSPEKLRARMEETAAALERERGLLAEAERRLRELQARLDTISKVSLLCYLLLLNPTSLLRRDDYFWYQSR